MLKRYEGRCCICKVHSKELLIASHIKPWSKCNNSEKVSEFNASFYSSMENMYWTVIEAINKSDDRKLYETFADRLKAVIEETEDIGWGFYDGLCDSYYSMKWIEEE